MSDKNSGHNYAVIIWDALSYRSDEHLCDFKKSRKKEHFFKINHLIDF